MDYKLAAIILLAIIVIFRMCKESFNCCTYKFQPKYGYMTGWPTDGWFGLSQIMYPGYPDWESPAKPIDERYAFT